MSRMESFLVVSKDKRNRDDYIITLCTKKEINTIDISKIEEEGTIGITTVRNLQKTLFLKPIRGKTKACVIQNAHTLTIEAQNALLKLLEEPPDNTIIILTADNKEVFLQTILSRCKIIELPPNRSQFTVPSNSAGRHSSPFTVGGIGQRLKLAQDLAKDKDEAILWMENAILTLRQEFIKNPSNPSLFINRYSLFQKAYVILKTTNTNPRLTLENLFLNL